MQIVEVIVIEIRVIVTEAKSPWRDRRTVDKQNTPLWIKDVAALKMLFAATKTLFAAPKVLFAAT